MDVQIDLNQIKEFSKKYNQDESNKIIEKKITKKGLEATCIDKKILEENESIFNIELPESKIQNQFNTGKCWIYAGLNMIKYDVSKNLNIDIKKLELSADYIAFFDKLEKSNNIYENVIGLEDTNFKKIYKEGIFKFYAQEGGYWQFFVSIVNKYGLIPKECAPSSFEDKDYKRIKGVYKEKVGKDILKLLKLKEKNTSIEELRKIKEKFLEENYTLLSKIFGEPKFKFDYEYTDNGNNHKTIQDITPIDFKNKFLKLKLNDFVSIGNIPMHNKKMNKLYKKKYLENIINESAPEYLNLPIEQMKELAIMQLKDGIPVWIGLDEHKYIDKNNNVMDKRVYQYNKFLNIDFLSKEENLDLDNISLKHAMTICGVNIENDKPQRWKIEDTKWINPKYDGYYVMNDNYFEAFVLNAIIDKKYLSDKQLKLLNQKPIKIEVEESF